MHLSAGFGLVGSLASLVALLPSAHAWTETPWSGNTWTEKTWFETYLTRPGQRTVKLNIITNSDQASLSPGYIWISPYRSFRSELPGNVGQRRWGPHIFDREGHLVWAGNFTTDVRGWGPGPCDFRGEIATHLCYTDSEFMEQGGHTAGWLKFFDNSYKEVLRLGAIGGLRAPDSHEINAINGGQSVINDVYEVRNRDLRKFGGLQNGFFLDGCFQDRDLANDKLLFQFCLSEVVPLGETSIFPPGKENAYHGGAGDTTRERPWDLFHINAIDQDKEGNYYVSSRNMRTVYKIAGRNHPQARTIIWKLCGNDNHFKLGPGVEFSYQHHVRVLDVTAEETTISVFDNAWDGIASKVTAQASSGKVIVINNTTMEARLTEQYFHPENIHTGFAGSNQVHLPNGNAFLGWGVRGELSEHAPNGKTLWYAKYGVGKDLESYRVWKRDWKGYPKDPPDVFAYSGTCDSDLMVYMSWNGATEYTGWRVFVSDSQEPGTGTQLGGVWPRMGYETMADLGRPFFGFKQFVYVEALGPTGEVLGTSLPKAVFVPRQTVAGNYKCNLLRCNDDMQYAERQSMASMC